MLSPTKEPLKGSIKIPGDKSISHRSIILASLAKGTTKISNFLNGEDCLRTIEAFREMGVTIDIDQQEVEVQSLGVDELKEPLVPLNFGNSGTTARLMLGLLAGLPFFTTVYGDQYLSKRPMSRVVDPVQQMNGQFYGRQQNNLFPMGIVGSKLTGIHYKLPVKSAQVKSAILLAGLLAEGKTTVVESTQTRNHTENMLRAFGADIQIHQNEITITNRKPLTAQQIIVPGDISSAAFFIVAGLIVPGSSITLEKVGLNETRTGLLDVIDQMGATYSINHIHTVAGEKYGDITVEYSQLHGIEIKGDMIPRLIDEIPIIALLATQAKGETVISDAGELRVKETDRIAAVEDVLTSLGATLQTFDDGMVIKGKQDLVGGSIKSYHDHRIAMMGSIASLITKNGVEIDSTDSIQISYPNFFEHLNQVKGEESTES